MHHIIELAQKVFCWLLLLLASVDSSPLPLRYENYEPDHVRNHRPPDPSFFRTRSIKTQNQILTNHGHTPVIERRKCSSTKTFHDFLHVRCLTRLTGCSKVKILVQRNNESAVYYPSRLEYSGQFLCRSSYSSSRSLVTGFSHFFLVYHLGHGKIFLHCFDSRPVVPTYVPSSTDPVRPQISRGTNTVGCFANG
jgi:hypothetical protein